MKNDLKVIKKLYGEKMAKFCKENFPTILEYDGYLTNILVSSFNPNHTLFTDLEENCILKLFKKFVISKFTRKREKVITDKTPEELLNEVGYILYECHSEEEIQRFKKYYADGEKICTFNGGRLNKCRVFFAVKKNATEIERCEYPAREDNYGTSVISIQFDKDGTNTLSIKNRYNDTVENADATFANDLDNIIPGLTYSFEKYYGIIQTCPQFAFSIPNYVKARDGRYYKYNYRIGNVYYCPNNTIIDNLEVKKYEKEKYLIFDYFFLDLRCKELKFYDKNIEDSFVETIGKIEKVEILNSEDKCEKTVYLTPQNGNVIEIHLDKENRMLNLVNDNLKEIPKYYLFYNIFLQSITLRDSEKIGLSFLFNNKSLEYLEAPVLKSVEDNFLAQNKELLEIYLPLLEKSGFNFLAFNQRIQKLYAPNLRNIGGNFLARSKGLKELIVPNREEIIKKYFKNNPYLNGQVRIEGEMGYEQNDTKHR